MMDIGDRAHHCPPKMGVSMSGSDDNMSPQTAENVENKGHTLKVALKETNVLTEEAAPGQTGQRQ
jgi:hypothetical protein